MSIPVITLIAFSIAGLWAIVDIRSGQTYPGHGDIEALSLAAMICFIADVIVSIFGTILADLGWLFLLVLPCTFLGSIVGWIVTHRLASLARKLRRSSDTGWPCRPGAHKEL